MFFLAAAPAREPWPAPFEDAGSESGRNAEAPLREAGGRRALLYWRSYSPLLTRLSTVNPAFFASVTESGLSLTGELKLEMTLRTGFLQAGQWVRGFAESGRRRVNRPPQTLQSPSQTSYS